MGQLERYGLYVLVLVIFLILGVAIWGGEDTNAKQRDGGDGVDFTQMVELTGGSISGDPGRGSMLQRISDQVDRGTAAGGHGGRNLRTGGSGGSESGNGGQRNAPKPGPVALRSHTIRKGDTLERISRSYLGKKSRWREILAVNSGLTEKNLRVGKTIKIPAGTARSAGAKGTNYTVQSGDNPSRISKRMFGTELHAKLILDLNPQLDPRKMRPGQVIRIPRQSDIR